MKPGVYHNMPAAEYHSSPGLSKSMMGKLAKSPAHLKAWMDNPSEETPAMRTGTLVHMCVLEPDQWGLMIDEPQCDKRTTEGKQMWSEFDRSVPKNRRLYKGERQHAEAIRDALYANPVVDDLLAAGRSEVSLFARHNSGTLLRCRLDRLSPDAIIDIKTTVDASPEAFTRNVCSMLYHLQDAHYLDLAERCGLSVKRFMFIAVEKNPPYCSAVYELDEEFRRRGMALREKLVAQYQTCTDMDSWPGYTSQITTLSAPKWAPTTNEEYYNG